LENAFSVIYKGHKYSMRTVVQDAWHMLYDPRSFWYNRVSPIARTAVELGTSRDWRGIKRTSVEQLGDLANWLVPVGFEGLLPGARGRELTPAQMAGQSVGIMTKRYTAATEVRAWAKDFNQHGDPAARTWQKQREQQTLPESDYNKLTTLLEMDDLAGARKEYQRLLKKGHTARAMNARYSGSHPFTGTIVREAAFVAQLDPNQARIYRRAQAEHTRTYQQFRRMTQGLANRSTATP
jgi:hypothetical protein